MRSSDTQRRGVAGGLSALALVATLLVPARAVRGDELLVAAAADLTYAFAEVSTAFEKHTGHRLRPAFGSSGNFFAQIRNGAPFDVFFSADSDYPRQLEVEGLAEPGSFCRYATGRIVLWVPSDSSLDIERHGLKALLDPLVVKIAIANPQHAPYGRAAVAALRAAGWYEKVEPKLVLGENVSQAAQFVASGNASAGIIALSLALSPAMRARGRYWLIPAEAHPPLDQAAVILKTSPHKAAARALLEYLRSAEGRALLQRYGFEEPSPPKGQP
ncbi:MAG: molybdate ABC transporter substrate-binding protein [Terriglobia bacterium]|jgi:molybdate transport system substrate-binding protein